MKIVVIAHNIRSILNLGAIFRTAEGLGVEQIILSGYTPNFHSGLPHVRAKMQRELHKTALGAEEMVASEYRDNIAETLAELKRDGFRLVGLEQDDRAVMLPDYTAPDKIALLLGEEVAGIAPDLRAVCDDLIEIPMHGQKESFNVAVATGIALYGLSLPKSTVKP
ncbi:MAG: TrmH family RNA methyltransferase [Candidatus Nomurabacteria bacterium]|jgi:tRNA G18 (ribose-2'-O)-methylase SpoU|nr:TrmH family RNA methyltransferase [Candidatus Nomurabacteria bacterium]